MRNIYYYISILLAVAGTLVRCCDQRYYEDDSFVCACSVTSCDDFPTITIPPLEGTYGVVRSSRDLYRFQFEANSLQAVNGSNIGYAKIFINSSDVRQTMIGFGGAFTDAAGINVAKLSTDLQDTFIRQYYSPDGLEYNIGRIPMAGTDFSTHPYSYDDEVGDTLLHLFNLTMEDYVYKIPMVKRAMELTERELFLFASPWSPPSWMKTNDMFNGSGSLLPQMRQPWANYFVKFLTSYHIEGIKINALTIQNEPTAGTTNYAWNCCHFTDEEERDFVRDYLGPTLDGNGFPNITLMVGDDQRELYPRYVETILNDEKVNELVAGIAVHWYSDSYSSANILTQVHDLFPDKFILYTEACNGYLPQIGNHVKLGNWGRGEAYASDIINNINHWSAGWTDWNLALDMTGGPNWASNFVDAPIIVNEESNEFYKQPMFYVMGHFSKFIPRGSKYIGSSIEVFDLPAGKKGGLDVSSFIHPDGYVVSVVLNTNEDAKTISIEDTAGNLIIQELPQKSLQTFYYSQ